MSYQSQSQIQNQNQNHSAPRGPSRVKTGDSAAKKGLKIGRLVLTVLLFAFVLVIMVFTVLSVSFNKDSGKGIFGYKFFVVLSDSMKATNFKSGDLVIVKSADASSVKVGDIIAFRTIDPNNYNQVVTHKVRAITQYDGKLAFTTYGTTTGVTDVYPAPADNLIGKYSFHIAGAGSVFQFLKSPPGYFTLVFIPFFVIIALQGFRFFRLLRQYKKEQQMEIAKEKAELDTAKQKTADMLAELRELREQLGVKTDPADVDAVSAFGFGEESHESDSIHS